MTQEITVSSKKPDFIQIEDEGVAAVLSDLLVRSGNGTPPLLPLNKLTLTAGLITTEHKEKYSWLFSAGLEDAEWSRKNQWLIQPEPSAWLVGKHMVVQAPWSLTLSDRLDKLGGYYYSHPLAGWVVNLADTDASEIDDILSTYSITKSLHLADYLEGRVEWRTKLQTLVADSLDSGFSLPDTDLFRTARTYKPWQQESILAMAYQGASMLADQVGLGKGGSFVGTSLCLNQYTNEGKIETGGFPVVIAVTKSMKSEIAEEVLRWWGDAQVEIINGTKSAPIEKGKDFYIINHDIIAPRVDDLIELGPMGFIADESHVYKTDTSKRTIAAKKLAKYLKDEADKRNDEAFIIMASGTPFLNAPIELWSILEILGISHIFGKYAQKMSGETTMEIKNPKFNFRRPESPNNPKRITVPITDKGAFEIYFCQAHFDKFGQWSNKGSAHVNELHKLLTDTGMVRRRKSDVMHPLPPLTENVVKISMSDDSWDEYERVDEEFREWTIEEAKRIAKEENTSVMDAVRIVVRKLENGEGMMRLTKVRQTLAEGKIDGTVSWIHRFMEGDKKIVGDDAEGRRKLIVFVHHREPRDILVNHPELQEYGVVTILPGQEQTGESIQEHKRLFQKDDSKRLMICSMAAREGHTLTAAKDVYLHELPFVPSWIVQMAGRCWARLSEDFEPHDATIHYAVVDGTEDARLLQMNRIKKATFNAVIDGEGQDDTINDIKEESVDTLIRTLALKEKDVGVAA